MENFRGPYKRSKTTDFLFNVGKFVYICGLPNLWIEDLIFPYMFMKMYDYFRKFSNWCVIVFLFSEYCAYFTKKNLTESQRSDLILFIISQTIIIGFCVRVAHQEVRIKDVIYKLGISLKEVYNDGEVEDQMIRTAKFFSSAFILNCVLSTILYTVEAILRVIRTGVTFNTVILVWPDIEDRSGLSNIGRALFNIIWWIYLTRIFAVYTLVICLTVAASHQFKNLNSYFYNLKNIFDDDHLSQKEKEQEYERALKVGIKLHSETLNCKSQIQVICREVFSGQIIFNISLLILLMYQMMNSPRTLTNLLTIVIAALTILLSTGFLMWNAGDITFEAESLPTAMFSSGWENCWYESSVRVRKLIVIAMMQAQQPVVLTGLGIIALSYQSYVSIVKSSYSVFSVVY